MPNLKFVHRCLKMPHAKKVGYFLIEDTKIYGAINTNDEIYFDLSQKEVVEKNADNISEKCFFEIPRAIVKESKLNIGDTILTCSVLNDGRRVIKDTSLFQALNRKRKGETRVEGFPPIIGSKTLANLLMEIYPEHLETISPFEVAQFNGNTGKWYDANTIPILCDLYMEAEQRKLITSNQQHILDKAKILLRSLARVGITALIDEATNYQDVREKDELQILLEQFITEELRAYSKEFNNDYFEHLFKLYNLPYDPTTQRRPRFFAGFTTKYVYNMLPPNVWDKLDEMNPLIYNSTKKRSDRKYALHQYLSEDKGVVYLREHLEGLTSVMKLSENIDEFKDNFNVVYASKIEKIEKMKKEYRKEPTQDSLF